MPNGNNLKCWRQICLSILILNFMETSRHFDVRFACCFWYITSWQPAVIWRQICLSLLIFYFADTMRYFDVTFTNKLCKRIFWCLISFSILILNFKETILDIRFKVHCKNHKKIGKSWEVSCIYLQVDFQECTLQNRFVVKAGVDEKLDKSKL